MKTFIATVVYMLLWIGILISFTVLIGIVMTLIGGILSAICGV